MYGEWGHAVNDDYHKALAACNGVLVNKLGRNQGVGSLSLFTGSQHRAYTYASEELVRYWDEHPRITQAQFERHWAQGRGLL